jgi:hypothetical protein
VKNIRATPVFDVRVGKRRFKAQAQRVSGEKGSELLMRYIDMHGDYVKGLYKMMGIDLDVISDDDLFDLLRK